MSEVDKITNPLKEIDNYPEFHDEVYEILEHLLNELKENGMTRNRTEQEPPHWTWVLTDEGMDKYDAVKDRIYEIAEEKFEDEYFEFNEPIEYA